MFCQTTESLAASSIFGEKNFGEVLMAQHGVSRPSGVTAIEFHGMMQKVSGNFHLVNKYIDTIIYNIFYML
jgi:hypothetical protein